MFFKTAYNGYAIEFSPFIENRVAVATAQNFGIIGNGRQYVLEFGPQGVRELLSFDTADGLYDCAWSEENENILVSASGDGSIKVWDLSAPPQMNPLRSFEEHSHEVYAVAWNQTRRDCFLSASWDDTIKLWNLDSRVSLRTFAEHSYCIYAVTWNPAHADVFASASGDNTVKIWDLRQERSTLTMAAHAYEILAADWNKYNDCVLATGSVDKSVKLWDVRMPMQPLNTLVGHTYAVRRVKCSPHQENLVYSCSYDMSMCMWDWTRTDGNPLLKRWDHHTEFAVGMDVSTLVDGLVASTGWDEMAHVWRQDTDPRA
mmetsp:Transcript_12072/g.20425  ORF Transcript_12072/g.20425 Transcript_12072/m.20425 type:complete len:316 (-) Transcript_12072:280-1227(-)|eukprot:CAMPEP_0198213104 /NCGR_PEP_ID=MMETSP1445-20131203/28675_1 /TAXON_ID=36898 /ORGANISM="Pyramimonas sp., Strain CCMP2087" /LENGTH=315 /DNA_ID=CAMNT_0043887701 /DNA_START=142 /DNA_END=1089 /DNA_ORIENTATION=-